MIKLYRKLQEYGVKITAKHSLDNNYVQYTFENDKLKMSRLVSFAELESARVGYTEEVLLETLEEFMEICKVLG